MRQCLRAAAAFLCCLIALPSALATNYYVSLSGDDTNAGTSAVAPWQTISKVNNTTFSPGDAVRFQGGSTFTGMIYFAPEDSGTSVDPILLSSYDTGRATIYGGGGGSFFAYDSAGHVISNLAFTGSCRTNNTSDGISFWSDLTGSTMLDFIRIDDAEVSGFGKWGIAIGGSKDRAGYRDVQITRVTAHDNGRGGMITYHDTTNLYVNQDVYIGHCLAYSNAGDPELAGNSGHGIVLGSASTGMIERCLAYGNGWLCDAGEGPVGIWAYDSERVTIQYNESYDNRTGGSVDGGGFDFDQNMRHSLMQYNYAHGNDGPGYLFAHSVNNDRFSNNVVRFNVSENDGRANEKCAIMVWGRVLNCEIHNNTIFMDDPGGIARGVYVWNGGIPGQDADRLHFRNNIFQTTNGVRLVEVTSTQLDSANEILFQGNNYYPSGSPFAVVWSATTYTNLAEWRAATTQEVVQTTNTGSSVDPRLTDPGGGGTIGDADQLETLTAYQLDLDSSLIEAGLDLSALFGIDPGSRDYYSNSLPQDTTYDVGAHEVPYDSDADNLRDTWEWAHFGTLATNATSDSDGDGADNYREFVAGTQPTNPGSVFSVRGVTNAAGQTNFTITMATEPGHHYGVEYTDQRLSNGLPWSAFANTNEGIGTWTETSAVATTYTFLDDFTTNTTSGEPSMGGRCYRITVENP